ncbi:MAG: hypothetical protein ABIN74_01675 [Ferruginibacter sp.]
MPLLLSVGIFIKQKVVQLQRRERFETELVQTITLSAEKIYWVKHGKEILVNGKLFDVNSFKTNGNQVTCTGFYDHEEDKLVKHITNLIHDDDDHRGPTHQFIFKFLCFPVYKELTGFSLQNNWQIIDRLFPYYSEALPTTDCAAALPPPKCC